MIQRFCFVKLSDAEAASRDALAALLRAQLADAGVSAIVGVPADDSAARWDLSITITAPSLDAWRSLALAPPVAALFAHLAARALILKSWTFRDGVH